MSRTVCRVARTFLFAVALSVLFSACVVGRSTLGTELSPGKVVEVEIGGRDPTMNVTNHGPGNVRIRIVSSGSEQDIEIGPGVNLTQELPDPSHLRITSTGEAVTTIFVALSNFRNLVIRD